MEAERAQASEKYGVVAQKESDSPWKAVISGMSKEYRQRLREYGITTDDSDLHTLDVNDAWTQLL